MLHSKKHTFFRLLNAIQSICTIDYVLKRSFTYKSLRKRNAAAKRRCNQNKFKGINYYKRLLIRSYGSDNHLATKW